VDPRIALLRGVLEAEIGAPIEVEPDVSGLRAGLRSHFSGLTPNQGPLFNISPSGLTRHRVSMRFGKFAGPVIAQMQAASEEQKTLARGLLEQLAARPDTTLTLRPEQLPSKWTVTGPEAEIDVLLRNVDSPQSEESVARTARDIIVPLMAAMAELIGYDEAEPAEYDVEGRVTSSTVTRRERSSRNRLLCLAIHGHRCVVCGLTPDERYGEAGSIIEVHHLEPVSALAEPRPYDPSTDLVPLCPNCHRAIHTRRPVPYTPDELKALLL
jgi:5-methylcytosine-specific restriction protein A